MAREIRRHYVEMDDTLRQRWERALRETEAEKAEILERGVRLRQAASEPTLSGQLRRAIPASALSLPEIERKLGISPDELGDFLVGDKPLPSDVMDRLAKLLGYELVPAKASGT